MPAKCSASTPSGLSSDLMNFVNGGDIAILYSPSYWLNWLEESSWIPRISPEDNIWLKSATTSCSTSGNERYDEAQAEKQEAIAAEAAARQAAAAKATAETAAAARAASEEHDSSEGHDSTHAHQQVQNDDLGTAAEGHDFSRANQPVQTNSALAAEVGTNADGWREPNSFSFEELYANLFPEMPKPPQSVRHIMQEVLKEESSG